MGFVVSPKERREHSDSTRGAHRRTRSGLRGVATVAALVVSLVGLGRAAHAAPFIPFDGPEIDGFNYGFLDPASYGITTFRTMDNYYQATDPDNAQADDALLHVEAVSFERCARSSDNCNSEFHVFDVVWDITFNADILAAPNDPYFVDLILVDSDPAGGLFDDNVVRIDYDSAILEGIAVDFQTANYASGAYYFVDLALGSMINGETKRVGFTYQVTGELPIGEPEVGFLFPPILPAAHLQPIPEPGTALLLGLGLVALASSRKRT